MNGSSKDGVTRRRFLRDLRRLGIAGLGLCACGRSGPGREEIAAMARSYDPELDCSDVRGLWPAEVATRTDNDYRDRSEQADRYCFNCSNFEEPAAPETCGTCRTIKGPIQPLGWCKSWTELQT